MRVRKRLLKWNRTVAPPTLLSIALREEMCATFAADIEMLSNLLDRDFSHWLEGPDHASPPPLAGRACSTGSMVPRALG